MMVPKTYREPHSETLSTFALASVSGALAAALVGALAPALLLLASTPSAGATPVIAG